MKNLIFFLSIIIPLNCFAWGTEEFKKEATSPVTTDAKYYLYAGAALTIGLITFDRPIDSFHNKVAEKKPMGKHSRYGDYAGQLIPNAAYIGLMLGLGDDDRAAGMFKATAYSAAVTTALKYTVKEPRPNNCEERNSFPSGHTTTAFAFAGYVASEHGHSWGIPAAALATFVGLSRVNDNRHRLGDVTAGAAIGLAYGIGISRVSKKEKSVDESDISFAPIVDKRLFGFSLSKDF